MIIIFIMTAAISFNSAEGVVWKGKPIGEERVIAQKSPQNHHHQHHARSTAIAAFHSLLHPSHGSPLHKGFHPLNAATSSYALTRRQACAEAIIIFRLTRHVSQATEATQPFCPQLRRFSLPLPRSHTFCLPKSCCQRDNVPITWT